MNFNNLQFGVRWLHVIAGITWIGLLYFFNFINVPFQAAIDDATKKGANPKLQPRALWWFRWGAMLTFLTGLLMFSFVYMYTPVGAHGLNGIWGPNAIFGMNGVSDRALWIMVMGMLPATIMWFNVWFIIWPAQKKILGGTTPAEQLPPIRRRAYLASRTNTYLSGPMLVGMLGANHIGVPFTAKYVIGWAAIGLIAIWVAIFHSTRVGTSV